RAASGIVSRRSRDGKAPTLARAGATWLCADRTSDDFGCENYSSSPSPSSAGIGVSVPNRPCSSSPPPAVKNRVSDDPAPPLLPKVSDQRPPMVTSESSGFRTKPMNFLVNPLNAAIQPPRKLPTRMVLLNSPKSRGVQTTPQGALNQSPCSRRPWN